MIERAEQKLLAPNGSIAAVIYPDKVNFPKDSYFNRIASLDVPEYAKNDFNGRRIIPKNDMQFRDAFMIEVERRLLQQGYRWEK